MEVYELKKHSLFEFSACGLQEQNIFSYVAFIFKPYVLCGLAPHFVYLCVFLVRVSLPNALL